MAYTRTIRNQKYTFVNNGTTYQFMPDKVVNLPEGPSITMLTYHMNLAKFLDSPAVYILDPLGAEIDLAV